MTTSRHERLTHYAAAASVVTIATVATADIIHRVVDQSAYPGWQGLGWGLHINALTGNTWSTRNYDPYAENMANFSPGSFHFRNFDESTYEDHWRANAYAGLQRGSWGFHVLLNEGAVIGGTLDVAWHLLASAYVYSLYSSSSTSIHGPSGVGVNDPTYIGFGINDPNDSVGTLYGWAQLMFTRVPDGLNIHIIDYAYDDTGAAITAGDTGATAVPGAGGLVALACGAAGLRRRRKPAKTPATTRTTTETA